MSDRQIGTVKWFNEALGYGFISHQNAPDVYVYFRRTGTFAFRTLKKGQRVSFDVVQGAIGPQAENVRAA